MAAMHKFSAVAHEIERGERIFVRDVVRSAKGLAHSAVNHVREFRSGNFNTLRIGATIIYLPHFFRRNYMSIECTILNLLEFVRLVSMHACIIRIFLIEFAVSCCRMTNEQTLLHTIHTYTVVIETSFSQPN